MVTITKDTEKLMDLYLQNMATAIETVNTIKEVIKNFDNKVFNARLCNKLEEVINAGRDKTKALYFGLELNTSSLKMDMRFYNHRSFAGEKYFCYLPNDLEKITLIPYTPSGYNVYYATAGNNEKYNARQDDAYFYLDGDKLRINADYINKRLDVGREDLIKQMAKITEDRRRIVEYETKREALAKELREIQCDMAYECKAVYNLKDYNTLI